MLKCLLAQFLGLLVGPFATPWQGQKKKEADFSQFLSALACGLRLSDRRRQLEDKLCLICRREKSRFCLASPESTHLAMRNLDSHYSAGWTCS